MKSSMLLNLKTYILVVLVLILLAFLPFLLKMVYNVSPNGEKFANLINCSQYPYLCNKSWQNDKKPDVELYYADRQPYIGYLNGIVPRYKPYLNVFDQLNVNDSITENVTLQKFKDNESLTNFRKIFGKIYENKSTTGQ